MPIKPVKPVNLIWENPSKQAQKSNLAAGVMPQADSPQTALRSRLSDPPYRDAALGALRICRGFILGQLGELIPAQSKIIGLLEEGKDAASARESLDSYYKSSQAIRGFLWGKTRYFERRAADDSAEIDAVHGLNDIFFNGLIADMKYFFDVPTDAPSDRMNLLRRGLANLIEAQERLEALETDPESMKYFLLSERLVGQG